MLNEKMGTNDIKHLKGVSILPLLTVPISVIREENNANCMKVTELTFLASKIQLASKYLASKYLFASKYLASKIQL